MDKDKTMKINEGNPVATTAFPESMTTSTGSFDGDLRTTSPLSSTFSIEDCVYRGEGNANIVVALPQEHKVIRFRKSVPDNVSPDDGKQRAEREVEFVRFVASCFLGPYTQIPEILRYDAKDITKLSEAIRPLRSDKRCNKEIMETYATKFPDYTFLRTKFDTNLFQTNETFCVEIKPKQGYLQDVDQKFQKCPYCLTQYYKLKKKMITCRSTYCPFDLFSGVETRMKSALKGLLKSPQNNLKIFKNGILVYDQESSLNDLECALSDWFRNSVNSTKKEYIDKFCNLICTALLHPFILEEYNSNIFSSYELYTSLDTHDLKTTSYINTDLIAKTKKFLYFAGEACDLKGETLPNNSVLERILRMQRLSFISSEYVYNTYSKFYSLLNDDIIYTNMINMFKLNDHRISYFKQKKTITENPEILKEAYIQTCAKDISTSIRSKFDDDYSSNKHINELNENIFLIQKSILIPMHIEKNNLWYNKYSTIHNENNIHCNEKETYLTINTESLLCLQNYLLFSCARDCSILMSFREINPNAISSTVDKNVIRLPDGLSFVCNIGISDIDPKSLHCIEKHRQRDIDVLNSVISFLEEELMIKNQSSSFEK
ncbi:inositol-pentakisphosphate 2-kinase isoform X3 [Apis laboriosa]|uniref:inositol-pentakisphosphate 2-kinase isoform X2 n=1 Tax=Apis laboriosa TaxID=183418 RepID=UPI001CC58029|nr:inositol-pentakisphosphate 2-kinase isoform X2 [Apis laboriosa]XP_043800807.1 inositol-pentakisphosphate 2-kinase isoform X3 [Apis laboriosa]